MAERVIARGDGVGVLSGCVAIERFQANSARVGGHTLRAQGT